MSSTLIIGLIVILFISCIAAIFGAKLENTKKDKVTITDELDVSTIKKTSYAKKLSYEALQVAFNKDSGLYEVTYKNQDNEIQIDKIKDIQIILNPNRKSESLHYLYNFVEDKYELYLSSKSKDKLINITL